MVDSHMFYANENVKSLGMLCGRLFAVVILLKFTHIDVWIVASL